MRWRLLHGPPGDGARQMALDEVLFLTALGDEPIASVRLYRFLRPTLSFGYAQRLDDVCRPEACREHGVDPVRRPTGGRALLHEDELTYAVAAPALGVFEHRSVHELYAAVRSSLASALEALGVPLDRIPAPNESPRASRRPASPLPCLASPERHELTWRGRKLVASAQRRRHAGFLQHGSVLLRFDSSLWQRIRPHGDDVPLSGVGLEEILGRPVERAELEAALAASFESLFGEPPAGGELTARERAEASRLEAKYRSEAWSRGGSAPTVDNSQAAW